MKLITNLKKWSPRVKNATVAIVFLAAYSVSAVAPFVVTGQANAAPVCMVDTGGANDSANQKDLTRMCVDYAGLPTSVTTTWNWDDLGTSGNNTMDACSLFDTDGDGNANYSVCAVTNGTPATFTNVIVYSCTDTSPNRCYGSAEVAKGTTACTVSQQNNDPFPAGDAYPTDTQGSCTIPLSVVGGASATLIDVCSYPSGSPNSVPSDCVLYRDNSARIEVKKVVDPATDPGLFNLKIGSTTYASNIGNGGTTGEQILSSGSITVSETAGTGTSLSSYTTSVVCRDANGTGSIVGQSNPTGATSRQFTFTAADASDVVCVFTNTRLTGTVTLVKSVTNNNGGALGANDFGLTIGGTAVASGQSVTLPAGVPVAINEAGAAGYAFVSLSGAGCPTAIGGTVTPVNGQNITCTITNDDQPGTLIVNKVVVNDNGGTKQPQNFQFKVGNGAAVNFEADGSNSMTVNTGTYNVTEVSDSGYTTTYDNCTNVAIPLGSSATCTITNNDKAATLILQKTVTNNNGGLKTASDFPVYIGSNLSSWGTHTVNAGKYNVHETQDPNYTASIWGADCDAEGNVTVGLGETKICSITNDDKPAMLSGTKFEVNATATNGTGATSLPNWTICLDSNNNGACDAGEPMTVTDASGNYSFTNLSVGTYGVLELGVGGSMAGWTQIFAPQPVALALGQSSTGNDFGNFRNGSISGHKWNDVNGNGSEDDGEDRLSGWTIQLKQGDAVVDSDTTDVNGDYSFASLAPGAYTVCEVQQTGWAQTYPSGNGGCHSVTINASGETNSGTNFGNRGRGTLQVKKDVDTDGDGDIDYANVTDWTWDMGDANYATGSVQAVAAGTYTVHEDQKENYHFTSVSCSGEEELMQGETVQVSVSPGENVVCTFKNTRDTGWVKVEKQLYPEDDAGRFNLLVDELVKKSDARDGDETGWVRVATGDHTLGETAGTATDMSRYDSRYFCWRDSGLSAPQAGDGWDSDMGEGTDATVPVTKGQYVICSFYNERHATLTIEKDAQPNEAQDFEFNLWKVRGGDMDQPALQQVSIVREPVDLLAIAKQSALDDADDVPVLSAFMLDDDSDPTLSNQKEFELSGSWYVVEEVPVDGWDLTDIDCGDSEDWYVDGDGLLNIWLQPGSDNHCTFTNTKRASLTVLKDAQPNSAQPFSFTFTHGEEEETFVLTDDGLNASAAVREFAGLLPGTYKINEATTAGWTFNGASCTGATVTRNASELTVVIAPGANAVCTFVNQKNTVPQVLGDATVKPAPKLENTGFNPLVAVAMSLTVIGLAVLTAFSERKRSQQTSL